MVSPRRPLSLALFICSLVTACASPRPLDVRDGVASDTLTQAKQGDALAMAQLEDAAREGNGAAEYALGVGLAEGWAGRRDMDQALAWWRRASEHGCVDAMNALGLAYAEGVTGAADLDAARALWQQAAEQGNANAQYNLGSLLVATAARRGDLATGAGWLRRAAEQGDADAQYFLGNLYENGEGVPRQPMEALRLWRQAASQGHAASESRLAEAYLSGTAVPVDVAEAEKWMRDAARHGGQDATDRAQVSARGVVTRQKLVERSSSDSEINDANTRTEPLRADSKASTPKRRELAAGAPERAKSKHLHRATQQPLAADRSIASASRDKGPARDNRVKKVADRSPSAASKTAPSKHRAVAREPRPVKRQSPVVVAVAKAAKATAMLPRKSAQGKSAGKQTSSPPRRVMAQAIPKPKAR